VGFTGFTLVMPFLPLYFRELGVTDTGDIALWTGMTLGVSPAIAALTAPLWGRVGDRFGSKLLVQRSLVSFIAVMIAMAYVTRAWHLFALRALQGFFAGYGPLTLSMAALSAPRDKVAAAIGTVQTAQRMGPTLGPVIGGILAPVVGLRNAFLVASGFYVVAFILLTFLFHEPPRQARRRQDGSRMSFTSILAFENFMLVMFLIFGLQLVDRSFGPVLPLYLGEIGYAADRVPLIAGILFSILAFTGALGNQLSSLLLRRHSPRVVVAWSVLVGASALAWFTASQAIWALALSLAVVGLCIGTSITTAYAAGNAVIPPEVHATAFGFLTGAALIGIALSPVLSGLVAARSIRAVFIVGIAALVVLAIVVRKVMVERNPPVESAPPMEEG
jgi:DHA1 family multidrug resistance protein-like MFS transporter